MMRALLGLIFLCLFAGSAHSQTSPGLMPNNTVLCNSSGTAALGVPCTNPAFTGLTLSALTSGITSCVQASSAGVLSLTGAPCGTGSGSVTSVNPANSTLTISPTTGVVVAGLNLASANTWTAAQTFPAGSLTFAELPQFAASTVLGNFTAGTAAATASAVPSCASDGIHALTNNAAGGFNCTTLPAAPVTSVSAGNSTLTISPITGLVVASLNLGNANTWTAVQTFPANSLTNAELAQMAADTVRCNNTSGTANVANCTSVITSMYTSLATSSWFSTDTPPANFIKYGDRFLGGDAINYSNTAVSGPPPFNVTCGTGDWFSNFQATTSNTACGYIPNFTMIVESKQITSAFPSINPSGAILAAGQTKENNFGGAFGLAAFGINNNTASGTTGPAGAGGAWAIYAECDQTVSAPTGCFAAEMETGNFVADTLSLTSGSQPADPFQQTHANSAQIGCGSGYATPTPFKCGAGAQIANVGNQFRVGLNVLTNSIVTQTFLGQTLSPAIEMPTTYGIAWFSAAATQQALIVTDTSHNLQLISNANVVANAITGNVELGTNSTVAQFIDASQNTTFGGFTNQAIAATQSRLQTTSNGVPFQFSAIQYGANNAAVDVALAKTRGANPSTQTIVQSGDGLSQITTLGSDGVAYQPAASIQAIVDAVPAANSMPGRLAFLTTQVGNTLLAEAMRIDNTQNTTLGGFANTALGTTPTQSRLQSVSTGNPLQFTAIAIGNNAAASTIGQAKTRGATPTTQTIVQNGDGIGQLTGVASDGATYQVAASVQFIVDAAPAAGSMPGRVSLFTTPSGSTVSLERLRIDNAGDVFHFVTFGYGPAGAGACGTVTQLTSITTAVTLNKACGTVTTVSNSFTAGNFVSFQVNDSTVAATDVVVITPQTSSILAFPATIAAGSFFITLDPLVTATSPVAVNYAVIKSQNN